MATKEITREVAQAKLTIERDILDRKLERLKAREQKIASHETKIDGIKKEMINLEESVEKTEKRIAALEAVIRGDAE